MTKIWYVELKEEFRDNFYYFCNGKKQSVESMNDGKPFYHCITVNEDLYCEPIPGNDTVIVQLDARKVEELVAIDETFMGILDKSTFEYTKFMYVLSVLERNL